jgi:hypothetical protein
MAKNPGYSELKKTDSKKRDEIYIDSLFENDE